MKNSKEITPDHLKGRFRWELKHPLPPQKDFYYIFASYRKLVEATAVCNLSTDYQKIEKAKERADLS